MKNTIKMILLGVGMMFTLLACGGGGGNTMKDVADEQEVVLVENAATGTEVGPYTSGEYGNINLTADYTLPADALFIDIRNAWERKTGFAVGSVGGAVYQFRDEAHPSDGRYLRDEFVDEVLALAEEEYNQHIIIICASSSRTKAAAKLLSTSGFTYIEHIVGGTNKWKGLGLGIAYN